MINPFLAEYIVENYYLDEALGKDKIDRIVKSIHTNSAELNKEPRPNETAQGQNKRVLDKIRKERQQIANEEIAYHLQQEGYADSYESALAITEAMSEEWMNEILEGFIKPETWEMIMKGYDTGSRAVKAIGNSMNAANRGGVRNLKPSTAANMERQARRLEKTNADKARAIRAMARHLTKVTPQQRRANWFGNRMELAH